MTETHYQLVFYGRLLPGASAEQARKAVKERFKLDSAQVERLFSGNPTTVKRDLDQASAERYQQAFAEAGVLVEIEPALAEAVSERWRASTPQAGSEGESASEPPPESAVDGVPPSSSAEPRSPESNVAAGPAFGVEKPEPLQLLPPGALIGEQSPAPAAPPDTSHLQLAPSEASSLEDCAQPTPTPPRLDLGALELAPIDSPQQQE